MTETAIHIVPVGLLANLRAFGLSVTMLVYLDETWEIVVADSKGLADLLNSDWRGEIVWYEIAG